MFQRRIAIGKLLGFEIRFDLTWLMLVAFIVWTLSAGFFPAAYAELSTATYVWMGILGAAGLFASIVLHELAHSVVGRHLGMEVHGITLFAFGGAAELGDEPKTPRVEFLMAIAGPAMSVVLAGLFYGLGILLVVLEVPAPIIAVISYLVMINLILAAFNMLPAFPLDGGRVLRAALWSWRNDLVWATRVASLIGGGLGIGLVLLGILNAVYGNLIGGVWLFLIGLFIRAAASSANQRLQMQQTLDDVPVRRLMKQHPVAVRSQLSVDRLVEDYLLGRSLKCVPVVEDGRLLGYVGVDEVKSVPAGERHRYTVADVMKPVDAAATLAPDVGATVALTRLQRNGGGRLFVVEDGALLGVVTLRDLLNYLSVARELGERTLGQRQAGAAAG